MIPGPLPFRRARRALLALLLLLPVAADEGSCRILPPDSEEGEDGDPVGSGGVLFRDTFDTGLGFWRTTTPAPDYDPTVGNPPASMRTGSPAGQTTGGVTFETFTFSQGLVIEADVFLPDTSGSAATPVAWAGLSPEGAPLATSALAAGQIVDGGGGHRYVVNDADVGAGPGLSPNAWHRLRTVIREGGGVEFWVDGALLYTSPESVAAIYSGKPVKVGGSGDVDRPGIDSVQVTRP